MTNTYRLLIALGAATLFATSALAQAPAPAPPPKPTTTFTGDLGYVSASGNTRLTTLSVGDKLTHTEGLLELSEIGSYVYGETNHISSANLLHVAARADLAFTEHFGGFAGVSYGRDTFSGYRRRTDEVLGVLWRALANADDSLNFEGGGVLTQQSNVDSTSESFPAARFAINYKHNFSKRAYFQQLAEYIPDLQTSGSYRVNTESDLVAPVSTHIGIKMSYSVRYDSRPPVNFGTTDRVITTGIQISY